MVEGVINMPKWIITKEKIKNINHYYFFDNEKQLYMISCIYNKNLKRYIKEFKDNKESYKLNF